MALAGALLPSQLEFPVVSDPGRLAVGYVRFDAIPVAGATVTIGGTEVWTAVAGAPGAREFQIAASAADTGANLKNAVNADAASKIRGKLRSSIFQFSAKLASSGNLALAVDTNIGGGGGGGDIVASGAAMVGAREARAQVGYVVNYTVTAEDLVCMDPTALAQDVPIAAFPTTSAPVLGLLTVRSSVGVPLVHTPNKPFAEPVVLNVDYAILLSQGGAAASLNAGDVVSFTVSW